MPDEEPVEVIPFTARKGREVPVGDHMVIQAFDRGRDLAGTLKIGHRLGAKLRAFQKRDRDEQQAARAKRGRPPLRGG
jgi:hypothetical protein